MDLSMDFIEGLPKSQGYSVIMVIVDRLTKFAHFVAVKHPYIATSIAQLFMVNVVEIHVLPNSIMFDRDTIFVSQFWKELFKLYTEAKHCIPPINRWPKWVNQCLEMYLHCAV